MNKSNYVSGLLFLAAAVTSVSGFSEAVDESSVNFGIQAGVNFANADVTSAGTSSTVTGLAAGPYAEVPLVAGLLYFQPELNYIQKGANNAAFGTPGVTRLDFIEAPLLAKAKVDIGKMKVFALGGPSAGVLINKSGPGAERMSSVDIGFKLGAGLAVAVTERSEVTFSVRKSLGITSIDSPSQWKSSGYEALVGFLF